MMSVQSTLFVLTVAIVVSKGGSNTILESPRLTHWGDWGLWEKCPAGQFVVGMRLKTERISYKFAADNTGLNGIQLFCAVPGGRIRSSNAITSSYANWGTWGSTFQCPSTKNGQPGIVTGFQMRSDRSRGILLGLATADDTAANNVRIFCSHDKIPMEGDGTYWGSWTDKQSCFAHEGVCGLRTQVEYSQGLRDDTALNNIQVECCELSVEVNA